VPQRNPQSSTEYATELLAGGYSIQELKKNYPHLTKSQILAALEYAADIIANEETIETV